MKINPAVDMSKIPPRVSNSWRRLSARAVDEWIVAADLGQTTDPTAVCVLNHRVVPLDTWTPNLNSEHWKQDRTEHFDVRHLERLALGLAYPVQVAYIGAILARPPLNALNPKLVIDETGVGRPVGDIFDAAGLRPKRVTITAGLESTRHGGNSWHVPKGVLISGLDARLHVGEFKIAAALQEAGALLEELKDFARKVSDAGRVTYNARVGKHDDLVLSCAIAVWFANNQPFSSVEPLRL